MHHDKRKGYLFGDFNSTGGSQGLLQITIDGKLTGSQGTNHEETSANTSVRATETKLLGNLDETGSGALTRKTLGLVDLGEHSVGGLRDNGGSETSGQTGRQVGNGLHAVRKGLLGVLAEDGLSSLLVNHKLGHGVGDPSELG